MEGIRLLIELSRIVLLIMQKRNEWTKEEQELFFSRVKDWAIQTQNILKNQENTFDSKAYLNALSEAKAVMFAKYQQVILLSLEAGKGLPDIALIKTGAFNLRYPYIKDKLLTIWQKTIPLKNKADEMAKEACELVIVENTK